MKRRVRLHYSTECFPSELPHKLGPVTESEQSFVGQERADETLDEDQTTANSVRTTEGEEDALPLREVKQEKKGAHEEDRAISEIISDRLQTNPIQLIKMSKENQFGNFHSYYDHRCETKWNDPRLRVLSRDWFLNKEVLDIGCNDGSFTLQIAIKYFPLKIQGVDIDHTLINKAVENLLLLEKQQSKAKQQPLGQQIDPEVVAKEIEENRIKEKLSRIPKCFLVEKQAKANDSIGANVTIVQADKKEDTQVEETNPNQTNDELRKELTTSVQPQFEKETHGREEKKEILTSLTQKVEILKKFPHNVKFRLENYVESMELSEMYDTICCFSTTKWIHLNFGDEGITRLFDKVFRSLRVNGIFILEVQEWRSYKKKLNYSNEFKEVIKTIKLHPGQFKDYLLKTYNFVLEKEITPQVNTDKVPAFFKRPVLVFKKLKASVQVTESNELRAQIQ